MTETTRIQELIEIFCDADRRQGLTAAEIEQYCPTVAAAMDVMESMSLEGSEAIRGSISRTRIRATRRGIASAPRRLRNCCIRQHLGYFFIILLGM